jgi:hypothetical protein
MKTRAIPHAYLGAFAVSAVALATAASASVIVNGPPPVQPVLSDGTLTADCSGFTVTANAASLAAGVSYTADYALMMSCSDSTVATPTGQMILSNSNGSGSGSASQSWGPFGGNCGVSGTATLTQNLTSTVYYVSTPNFMCSVPTIKTFSIGPSSMEGHLTILPGDWISGGYSFKFKNGSHAATTFSVTSTVTVPVTCPKGGGAGGNIVVNLGTKTYTVPAGNTDWLPTGDQNSVLSWMGAAQAADLCGGKPMDNAKGAIFTATVSQNPESGSLVDFRFKYRDPNAKGKGNLSCLDALNPLRNKADVCGASWSETVTDP